MKKLTAISLFLFWAFVAALLTSGLVLYQNSKQTPVQPQVGARAKVLSMDEIAKHNNASSCWLLIEGKVYDVTSYIYQHPGNADTIIPTCGTDATQAYNTKGRTSRPSPHSQNAHELLKQFYIGDLGQIPVATTRQAADVQTTTVQQPGNVTSGTPSTNTTVTLSSQEIAKHSNLSSCWMIINGNVYNVTSYVNQHPGGVAAITQYCGKDGTAAFEGLPHSTSARQLLANFYIGSLGKTATTQTIQRTASPSIPSGAGRREFEND